MTLAVLAATPSMSASLSEEIAIMTAVDLDLAVKSCGFTLDRDQLVSMLKAAGLALEDVDAKPRSPQLQTAINDRALNYKRHRPEACDLAFDIFGGSYQPLLSRGDLPAR